MADIRLHPAAEADYEDAYDWYLERSERAALRFEKEVERALKLISESPSQWPLCDERHRLYLLKRYPYSIVYRTIDQGVLVIAIAHARRKWAYWKHRA